MTSRVDIRRTTGDSTPGTDGYDVPGWTTVRYDVPFRLAGSRSGDGGSRSVAVGDFNNDGKQDLATANYSAGSVSVSRDMPCTSTGPSSAVPEAAAVPTPGGCIVPLT